ncbi:MAG: TPM domain-containing protein [Saprospiraceae bacterium]|nr:TPM domain-containing protein [Saprospiraceae bacterium]
MNCQIPFRINNLWLTATFFLLSTLNLLAAPLPQPTGKLVSDFADLLTPQEESALELKLRAYNDSTSTQIAIVTETTLGDDDAQNRSYEIASNWSIGQEGKNNGILIYVARNERKIFIQTGYGVEGFLTDAMSRRIIETIIKPAFRQEQYFIGLDGATDKIISLGNGEFQAEPISEIAPLVVLLLFLLFFLLIVFISYKAQKANNRGYNRRGYYDYDNPRNSGGGWWIGTGGFGNGNDDSWGRGGGGGGFGDFGGFGGGSFGGGGAGGDW